MGACGTAVPAELTANTFAVFGVQLISGGFEERDPLGVVEGERVGRRGLREPLHGALR